MGHIPSDERHDRRHGNEPGDDCRDPVGTSWSLALTIGSVKRVRDLAQVDLLDPTAGTPPLMTRLDLDVCLLADVLFALVQPEADARGIDAGQFAEHLGPVSIAAAHAAFWEEYADFFRQAGRPELAALLDKQRTLTSASIRATLARIEAGQVERAWTAIEARHQAQAEQRLAELTGLTPGNPSITSPGPSG
jgi:hypothetical protein